MSTHDRDGGGAGAGVRGAGASVASVGGSDTGAGGGGAASAPAAPPAPTASTVRTHEPNRVAVTWRGDRRFDAARSGAPAIRIDGDSTTGPSPVDALLSAVATCSAVDVVDILKKRRTPVESLEVEVIGRRVETVPRRLEHVLLRFHITGAGIEREQALRAIELAVTKYCSVRDSLDPRIPVEWDLVLG